MPYYHGTIEEFLPEIRKKGLMAKTATEVLMAAQVRNPHKKAIFVSDNERTAWDWAVAASLEWYDRTGKATNPVVLQIDDMALEGCKLAPDVLGSEHDFAIVGCPNVQPRFLAFKVHSSAKKSLEDAIRGDRWAIIEQENREERVRDAIDIIYGRVPAETRKRFSRAVHVRRHARRRR